MDCQWGLPWNWFWGEGEEKSYIENFHGQAALYVAGCRSRGYKETLHCEQLCRTDLGGLGRHKAERHIILSF